MSQNCFERVGTLTPSVNAYKFGITIKGIPAYWKKFLLNVLAMVRQLRLSTISVTLNGAHLRWNDLIYFISQAKGENFFREYISDMNFFQKM